MPPRFALAERAWTWANATRRHLQHPPGVATGEYGPRAQRRSAVGRRRLWRTTRDTKRAYQRPLRAVSRSPHADSRRCGATTRHGAWLRAGRADAGRVPDNRPHPRRGRRARRSYAAPYRNSMTTDDYYWGSIRSPPPTRWLVVAPHCILDRRYPDAALRTFHYLFGRNRFVSWVRSSAPIPSPTRIIGQEWTRTRSRGRAARRRTNHSAGSALATLSAGRRRRYSRHAHVVAPTRSTSRNAPLVFVWRNLR